MRRINIHKDQLALPFDTIRTGAISYDYRVHFFWVMMTVSIVALCTYIYAINATARHVAERQALEKHISTISLKLDSLEFAYIELRNNVTLEMAYAQGFKEEKSPLFVSRDTRGSLTYNGTVR